MEIGVSSIPVSEVKEHLKSVVTILDTSFLASFIVRNMPTLGKFMGVSPSART